MPFSIDHDLHIHSCLSTCSRDPEQTPERILRYAMENGLSTVCLTDHFWDSAVAGASPWYEPQNFEHISAVRPLPQTEGVSFLFGCETELDRNGVLGISPERMEAFDFIVIPTTHFHMKMVLTPEEAESAEGRAKAWIKRMDQVLAMDLPFHKVGIAHMVCPLIARGDRETYLRVLTLLPDSDLIRIFTKAASCGVGIELNASDFRFSEEEKDVILRPFLVAKACGCKFYLGSDCHTVASTARVREDFERAVTLLDLKSSHQFRLNL